MPAGLPKHTGRIFFGKNEPWFKFGGSCDEASVASQVESLQRAGSQAIFLDARGLNQRYRFRTFEDLREFRERPSRHFVAFRMTESNPDSECASVHLLKSAWRRNRDPSLRCLCY
jgi:hypothetical protein